MNTQNTNYLKYKYRPFQESDRNFIYKCYLRSIRSNYPYFKIPQSIYFSNKKKELDQLLITNKVLVAYFPEEPETILNFTIYNDSLDSALVIHFTYTISDLRCHHLFLDTMTFLLNNKDMIVTTIMTNNYTYLQEYLSNKLDCSVIYNPWVLE